MKRCGEEIVLQRRREEAAGTSEPVVLLPWQTNHTAPCMQPGEGEPCSLLGREHGENDA